MKNLNLCLIGYSLYFVLATVNLIMEARDFYDKRINEEPTIGSVQLMEEYAKHIIEINFCDGSPIEFNELSVEQLKKIHKNVNMCVDWVNS